MITSELTTHFKCGCFYSTSRDETGELCLIYAHVCSKCFDEFQYALEQLSIDVKSQLTLDLPSRHGPANPLHSSINASTS